MMMHKMIKDVRTQYGGVINFWLHAHLIDSDQMKRWWNATARIKLHYKHNGMQTSHKKVLMHTRKIWRVYFILFYFITFKLFFDHLFALSHITTITYLSVALLVTRHSRSFIQYCTHCKFLLLLILFLNLWNWVREVCCCTWEIHWTFNASV